MSSHTYTKSQHHKYFTTNVFFTWSYLHKLISTSFFGSPISFGGGVKITPLVFSKSTYPIHLKFGKYHTQHRYFQKKNQNGTQVTWLFWWCDHISWNFVKFSETHHWCNHYSYDATRIKRGKNTKNMKFAQNYKFPKIFRCFQQISHCRTCERCRTLTISQNMSNRFQLKVTKT